MKESSLNKLIVYHYPYSKENPYQRLLFEALRLHGVEPVAVNGLVQLLKEAAFGKGDLMHLHWVHRPAVDKSLGRTVIRMFVFHFSLLLLRIRRIKIVWTVHNLVNHEKHRAWLDRLNSIIVSIHAKIVLIHGKSAAQLVKNAFGVPDKKFHVVYHGNYEGVISPSPLDERNQRGIRFLFFGAIRPYKGVIKLIDTFGRLAGKHCLHIAGLADSEDLKNEIFQKSNKDDRIGLSMEFISEKQLEDSLAWCDVVVLPYKDILTSGALLMAMTSGRPVIAPKSGLIPEYVNDDCAFLYDPSDPDGLFLALNKAVKSEQLENMAACSLNQAQKFKWGYVCADLVKIYQELNANMK